MPVAPNTFSSRHHPMARTAPQQHRARLAAPRGKVPYGVSTTGKQNYTAHNNPKTSLNTNDFSGSAYDGAEGEVLDLWYFRARYFDAELGRFISRDPLTYVDGASLYRGYFVPWGLDPTGLKSSWSLSKFNGAILPQEVASINCDDCINIKAMVGVDAHLGEAWDEFAGTGIMVPRYVDGPNWGVVQDGFEEFKNTTPLKPGFAGTYINFSSEKVGGSDCCCSKYGWVQRASRMIIQTPDGASNEMEITGTPGGLILDRVGDNFDNRKWWYDPLGQGNRRSNMVDMPGMHVEGYTADKKRSPRLMMDFFKAQLVCIGDGEFEGSGKVLATITWTSFIDVQYDRHGMGTLVGTRVATNGNIFCGDSDGPDAFQEGLRLMTEMKEKNAKK